LLCLVSWPYYPVTALFSASAGLDAIHRSLYDYPWLFYGLLPLTLPALWLRWRRQRLDSLVLLFLGCAAVVAVGWFTGRYALGRVWPGVMLAGQLALAVEVAATRSRWWIGITAAACLAGTVVQGSNLLYLAPPSWLTHRVRTVAHLYVGWPDYAWLTRYARPGDVLLTDDFYACRTVGAYGIYTVAPAWPDPFLPDEAQRRADLLTLERPTTEPAARAALLRRYHVRWILEKPGRYAPVAGLTPVATGPDGMKLYPVGGP
jgi:alpha-1,6-mannosyltransferase